LLSRVLVPRFHSLYSYTFLVHNKKMNVHIIDSNSDSDEEMSNTTAKVMNNTPPNILDDNRNNSPVTINYINKYVLQIVNFSFCWHADKKYYKKLLICINKFVYLKKVFCFVVRGVA
jgi:hypothetical protein